MLNIRQFVNGLRIIPSTSLSLDRMGELQVNVSDGKLVYHDGSSSSSIITATSIDTLTNKSIDALTNNVSNIDDGNISSSASISLLKLQQITIGDILIGNASGDITSTTMSGDATLDDTGVITIQNNVVTLDKLAPISAHRILGNNTSSSANIIQLTGTQVTAELDNFIGDSGSGGTKGLVPAPSAGDSAASKFLKADGSFSVVNALSITSHSDNTTYFLTFVGANSTSTQSMDVGSLSYNPSTNILTATTFNGNLSGNATTATSATTATTAGNVSGIVLPSHGGTGIANNDAATLTRSGNFAKTETLTNTTNVTYPTTGTLATLDNTENFSNKTFLDPITFNQSGTPSNPTSGKDKLYFKSDDNLYRLDSTGAESLVGSGGGSSGINFIPLNSTLQPVNSNNVNAESSIGNWVTYADAAGTSPVDMTGGSSNLIISRTITVGEILNGSGSFKVVKDAANRQGQGVSVDFYVPPGYTLGPQTIKFRFKVISGSITKGDLRVFAYDITNSQLITPDNLDIIPGSQEAEAVFTLPNPTTITQLRIGIHIATTSASALTFVFDDIFTGNGEVGNVPTITDEQAFTPTFTGWGTVSGVDFFYRQVGDNFHIRGKFTSGTTTATEARITLPNGSLTDSTKISSIRHVGVFNFGNAAADPDNAFLLAESNVSYLTFGFRDSGTGGLTKKNGNDFASAVTYSIDAIVPIAGASASNPSAFSSIYTIANILANGTRVTTTPATIGEYRSKFKASSSRDFTAGTDTAPSSPPSIANGIRIYAKDYASAGTSGEPNFYEIYIGKNKVYKIDRFSTTGKTGNLIINNGQNSTGRTASIKDAYDPTTGILFVTAGSHFSDATDVASVGFDEVGNLIADGYFDIIVADNLAALSLLNVQSEVRVQTGNNYGSINTKIVRFTNIKKNVGNDITYSDSSTLGGSFTVNTSGVYSISGAIRSNSAGTFAGATINSTALTSNVYDSSNDNFRISLADSSAAGFTASFSSTVYLNANDVIRIHGDGASTVNDQFTWATITKV